MATANKTVGEADEAVKRVTLTLKAVTRWLSRGWTDRRIAEATGQARRWVGAFRRHHGLDRNPGHVRKLDPDKVREWTAKGWGLKRIAAVCGVGKSSVAECRLRHGIKSVHTSGRKPKTKKVTPRQKK